MSQGFLSQKAQKNTSNRQEYVIDEDRVIVDGLEQEKSASEIAEQLVAAGFNRTAVSVRYRIQRLRAECDKFETLEEFHASKVATPAPVAAEEAEGDEATKEVTEEEAEAVEV